MFWEIEKQPSLISTSFVSLTLGNFPCGLPMSSDANTYYSDMNK